MAIWELAIWVFLGNLVIGVVVDFLSMLGSIHGGSVQTEQFFQEVVEEFRRQALAHLVIIPAWLPLFFYFLSCFLIGGIKHLFGNKVRNGHATC